MNKKLLVEKIFSFMEQKKTNLTKKQKETDINKNGMLDGEDFKLLRSKKNVSEGLFDSLNLNTDRGLGNVQDFLATAGGLASLIPVPGVKAIAMLGHGLGALTNIARQQLDRTGLVPSTSGDLNNQGNFLIGLAAGRGLQGRLGGLVGGLGARGLGAPAGRAVAGRGGALFPAVGALGLSSIFPNQFPMSIAAGSILGASKTGYDDALGSLLSTEYARRWADPVSKYLGIPNIPGFSKRMTEKQPLANQRDIEVAKSANRLKAIAAVNQSR